VRGLFLDPRNLVTDVAAGRRQRAQFVDLGIEFRDGLFEIEIAAHGYPADDKKEPETGVSRRGSQGRLLVTASSAAAPAPAPAARNGWA
jgi:hypothetical protein